ncbi:MAG: FAD-binding protein [Clostridia bacterium]|nr:FAD-binding protein [Clostridia bacterium]
MKIVVCIRQGLDGEIGQFDACAYEAALRVEGAEVILLSMGAQPTKEFLERLTRLGASRAVLLCDKAFAGADTLATAYALGKATQKLSPDYIFCGRQTLIGDTAQTPPMLAEMLGFSLITGVMEIREISESGIVCQTRNEGEQRAGRGTLITLERINTLRLPRLRSKMTEAQVWSAADIGADPQRCGLIGSPTRVLKTFENQSGKRKCTFVGRDELDAVIEKALAMHREKTCVAQETSLETLERVFAVGEAPLGFAKTVSRDVTVIELSDVEQLVRKIREENPSAVIWGSDSRSKAMAARVAARLSLGLCADCTRLAYEDGELMMYRPALSGSIIAKIKSLTRPAMATVRTDSGNVGDVIVGVGYGVRDELDRVRAFADSIGAELAASRRLVDNDYMPYERQVGLTGRTVSPPVYVAIGISGAVHHIVGMQSSGAVIAVNPDKDAPIFEYADFGIIDNF